VCKPGPRAVRPGLNFGNEMEGSAVMMNATTRSDGKTLILRGPMRRAAAATSASSPWQRVDRGYEPFGGGRTALRQNLLGSSGDSRHSTGGEAATIAARAGFNFEHIPYRGPTMLVANKRK
jgi:hypothetical protein